MVFKNYSKYYNLLYQDKDYIAESNYIIKLISEHTKNAYSILDVGCGTGKHAALMAQDKFQITGIDISKEMVDIAISQQYPNCQFLIANATDFRFGNKFDAITSLFHVISYQTSNEVLENVFLNVKKHLTPNGVFIFDFWYAPAVLTQQPSIRIKRLEDDSIKVTRLSEPVQHFNENIIDVNFELNIEDKITGKHEVIKELHQMRYFSIPELNFILEKCGLQSIRYEEWLTSKIPSEKTWGVCCIAKIL